MGADGATVNRPNIVRGGRASRYGLRFVALGYLTVLLLAPVTVIFIEAFGDGIGHAIDAVTTGPALNAFKLTLLMVAIAVPLNTIFGVAAALVIVRQDFRGKSVLNALIDVPFAISPVVIGLALVFVYNPIDGWFGEWLFDNGIRVLFSPVGMAIATVFVSLPFVVREVIPVLREIGDDQEQAATTLGANGWQTFWRITLPSIRWGLTYGVILATARALGEFGAVAVVSGKRIGDTETLPLYIRNIYDNFDPSGAYAAAVVLALIALVVLVGMNLIQRRDRAIAAPAALAEPAAVSLRVPDDDPKEAR